MKNHKYVRQQKLIDLLHERHISQSEFAETMGMSLDCMSAKLNGRRQFTLQEALRVSELLGVRVEDIFEKEAAA